MTVQQADLRVLHVVSSTDRRGAETAAVDLHRSLAGLGCKGEVVALTTGRIGGLAIPSLGSSRFGGRTLQSLRARCGAFDVVVAHGSSTLPAVAVATIASSTPFVYRSIGDPRSWMSTPFRRARVRLAARRSSGIVALWRDSAVFWNETIGVRPESIEVIPNGVDESRFPLATADDRRAARAALRLPLDALVVLCLGSLTSEKRIDLAIRAVASSDRATILLVVGDGPQRPVLEQLGNDLLGRRAVFAGRMDDPWSALAACDLLMVPSDTEGQPAAAIEAGLTGRPVVATRVGGVPEVIVNGRTGALVEAKNPSALAAGIDQILSRELSLAAAREHCLERFALGRISPSWVRFLQRSIT